MSRSRSPLPRQLAELALAATLSLAAPLALADAWDGADESAAAGTHDLTHGADEDHDLARRSTQVADTDWYRLPQDPWRSYELVVDGVTSVAGNLDVQRFDQAGGVLYQNATTPTLAGGLSRSLAWANYSASAVTGSLRVQGADCGTSCNSGARYRIRAYDTTIAVTRFNNTGTQVTVLVLQNTRSTAHAGAICFWSSAGTLLASFPFSISPNSQQLVLTSTIVPGASGTMTIPHDAGYGGLNATALALEPSTGYSFEYQGQYRPR